MKRRDQIIQGVSLLLGLGGLTAYCIRQGAWGYSLLIAFVIVIALYLFDNVSFIFIAKIISNLRSNHICSILVNFFLIIRIFLVISVKCLA